MKQTLVKCVTGPSAGWGNLHGSQYFVKGMQQVFDEQGMPNRMGSNKGWNEFAANKMQPERYGKGVNVTTKFQYDRERWLTKEIGGTAPYPAEYTHGGSTARRTGWLLPYPIRKYPNPKRHRPILTVPQPILRTQSMGPNTLLARAYQPLELKNKKYIERIEYKRPVPPARRQKTEMYTRIKQGLMDLDRTMPALWGPQEGYKLDRDEWMFKLLYFNHPISEADLTAKADQFPHNPFDNPKDMIMSLERLVSREYVRRLKGSALNMYDLEPNEYYWTLMPDELEFGERVVVEETYLQRIREEKPIKSPMYPIRKEMCELQYQEKHNTFSYMDEVRDVAKLESFVEFCRAEREAVREKLAAINCTKDFPEDTDEEIEKQQRVYPDPPCFLTNTQGKVRWLKAGHWNTSIPDPGKKGPMPTF